MRVTGKASFVFIVLKSIFIWTFCVKHFCRLFFATFWTNWLDTIICFKNQVLFISGLSTGNVDNKTQNSTFTHDAFEIKIIHISRKLSIPWQHCKKKSFQNDERKLGFFMCSKTNRWIDTDLLASPDNYRKLWSRWIVFYVNALKKNKIDLFEKHKCCFLRKIAILETNMTKIFKSYILIWSGQKRFFWCKSFYIWANLK